VVAAASPVSEYVVDVLPVFDTMVVQLEIFENLSILYPVIAEPPLFEGAVHDRLTCDDDTAVVASPVGGQGAVAVLINVVADAVLDGELVPIAFIAET